MPTNELTDRFCQSAKVLKGQKKENFFDTTVKGLCLRVTAGGAKTFFLVYTKPGSKDRAWLKLGRYPELKLADARQKARDGRGKIGEGSDPIAEKKAEEASQTVADMVENYIARHATSKRSGAAIARRLRKNVSAVIGPVKLATLHKRDITKCIDAVMDRGAKIEANRVFEDLRAMVRWAFGSRGDLDVNIVQGMKKPSATTVRDRVLGAEEIKTVWEALPGADMRESTRRILKLLLITAQRESEVAGMMKDELNLAQRLWTIPGTRTKNKQEHVVPLSDLAVAIIQEQIEAADALAKRKGRKPLPFVFPGPGGRAAVTGASVPKAVKRVEEEAKDGSKTIMGVAPWTPHDLRRSAATGMEEIGLSPFIVGHVLNHISVTKSTVTSRVYARYTYDKEKREALELWAKRIAGIIAGGADIIPLHGAG